MRHHIFLGRGRYVHKHLLHHALHYHHLQNYGKNNNMLKKMEQLSLGESVKKHKYKEIKPLHFKL